MSTIPAGLQTTATSTLTSTGSGTSGSANVQQDYNNFLSLLTTELQNQDPTSPVDSTTFTQQLIGLTQLQEQDTTNSNLNTLIGQGQTSSVNSAVSYINQVVKAQSSQFDLTNNVGYVSYDLPSSAASATVSITDSTGKVINTFSGATTSGMHDYSWNGLDTNGNTVPDGTYSFNVSAVDASGNAITGVNTYTTGVITAVDLENGSTTLHMGNGVSSSTDIAFTTDKIASIEGTYATTPTVANPTTTQSIASTATNAVSSAASTINDALNSL